MKYFRSVFCMCSKYTTQGASKSHCLSLQQSLLSTEIVCLADFYRFQAVNTINCNSSPLENRLIYLALTGAWSEFYLFLCPKFYFCHGTLGLNECWFKWIYFRKNWCAIIIKSSCVCPGADLLKLTREDLVQICGPADGIRLYNALKSRWCANFEAEWI